MRIRVIVNPAAGRGRALSVWSQVKEQLSKKNISVECDITIEPGHAVQLAKEAADEDTDIVAVIGGDGTIHEAVNGLIGSQTALAVIPGGTGNDFAKSLQVPKSITGAVAVMLNPVRKKIDLIKYNNSYLINMAGLGFDAEVARRVNGTRFLKGEAAYLLAILKTLVSYRPLPAEIVIDGIQIKKNITLVAVGNGQYVGGGVRLLPQACIDDGLLDICIMEETTKPDVLITLPSVYAGRHVNHPKCTFYKAREVTLRVKNSNYPVYAQFDGQVQQKEDLHLSIAPLALEVLAPC